MLAKRRKKRAFDSNSTYIIDVLEGKGQLSMSYWFVIKLFDWKDTLHIMPLMLEHSVAEPYHKAEEIFAKKFDFLIGLGFICLWVGFCTNSGLYYISQLFIPKWSQVQSKNYLTTLHFCAVLCSKSKFFTMSTEFDETSSKWSYYSTDHKNYVKKNLNVFRQNY